MVNKVLSLGCLLIIGSCQIQSPRYEQSNQNPVRVSEDYKLKEDRQQFEQLRSEIPSDKREQNDEKALFAEWMSEVKKPPEVIREKFNTIVRKKRELFNKDMGYTRDQFSKSEKKLKEEFNSKYDERKNEIKDSDDPREKKNKYFEELESERRDFTSELRQKRDDFEIDSRQRRKDFEDYIKEKSDEFSSELKMYQIKWKEKQSLEK